MINSRNQAYKKLFGIDVRAARNRINKEKKSNLKPYEKLFKMLKTEEINSLVEFLESEKNSIDVFKTQSSLVLRFTKDKYTYTDMQCTSSSPNNFSMKIDGTCFNLQKITTKSDELIIQEWLDTNLPINRANEDDKYEIFEQQKGFLCEEAYHAYCDGESNSQIVFLESEYLTKMQSNNDQIFIGNYENFIVNKYRLQQLFCKDIFERNFYEIQNFSSKKEVLDFLLNKLFPNEFFLKYIAEMFSMPSLICKHLGTEAFEKLYTENSFFS